MITNIWLKSQPNKKISYPDCYPSFFIRAGFVEIWNPEEDKNAEYLLEQVSRIEFRP
jgi:hypothetical protein